jgi:hypothetical protein
MLHGHTEPAARVYSRFGAIHWRTQSTTYRVVHADSNGADKEEHHGQPDIS